MILTHTLITFYLAIICLIFVIVNIKKIKKKQIIDLAINVGLALVITAFYTVPLMQSKMSAEYEVFKSSHMLRENVLIACKVKPLELLFIENNRMAYFLGIPVILGIVLTVWMINKIENKESYFFFLIMGIICVVLTMDFVPFEKFPGFMTMMQFSFRLLEFSSFFLSVIAALNLGLCFKELGMAALVIILLVTADLLIPITKNIDFGNRYIEEDALIQGVPVSQNTGRVHAGCASFEYLPSKAFQNRSYIETRDNIPIVLEGNAKIFDYEKTGTNCSFMAKGYGKIELPYIYYIGYTAKVNGKKTQITESEKGFLQIELGEGLKETNKIEVSYTGTTAMKVSLFISIVGLITLIIIYFFTLYNLKMP